MSLYQHLQARTCRPQRSSSSSNNTSSSSISPSTNGVCLNSPALKPILTSSSSTTQDILRDLGLLMTNRFSPTPGFATPGAEKLFQRTQEIVVRYGGLSLEDLERFLRKEDFLLADVERVVVGEGVGDLVWGEKDGNDNEKEGGEAEMGNKCGDKKGKKNTNENEKWCVRWENKADQAIIQWCLRCWVAARIRDEVYAAIEKKTRTKKKTSTKSEKMPSVASTAPACHNTTKLACDPYRANSVDAIKKEEQSFDVEIGIREYNLDSSKAMIQRKRKHGSGASTMGKKCSSRSNKRARVEVSSVRKASRAGGRKSCSEKGPETRVDPPFFDAILQAQDDIGCENEIQAGQAGFSSRPVPVLRSCLKKRSVSRHDSVACSVLDQSDFGSECQDTKREDDVQCPSSQPEEGTCDSSTRETQMLRNVGPDASVNEHCIIIVTPERENEERKGGKNFNFAISVVPKLEPPDPTTEMSESLNPRLDATLQTTTTEILPVKNSALIQTQKQLKRQLTFLLDHQLPYSVVTKSIYPLATKILRASYEYEHQEGQDCRDVDGCKNRAYQELLAHEGALHTWKGVIDKLEKDGKVVGYTGSPLSTTLSTLSSITTSQTNPYSHFQPQTRIRNAQAVLEKWAKRKCLENIFSSETTLEGWCGDLSALLGGLLSGLEHEGEGLGAVGGELKGRIAIKRRLMEYNRGLGGWFGFEVVREGG